MKRRNSLTPTIVTILLLVTFASVNAKGRKDGKRKPLEEAFTACANVIEEGAACSFETPKGDEIEGTCVVPRHDNESLFCKPNKKPQR